jgi:hypothetical protein
MCPQLTSAQFSVIDPTLVFMPHCELDLYERLWRANWTADTLPRILLIGNDLREYSAKYVRTSYRPSWMLTLCSVVPRRN